MSDRVHSAAGAAPYPAEGVVTFNVNHDVLVRLTAAGRIALRQEHDDLFASWPEEVRPEYTPPCADTEGWSRFQLWDLMHRLGRACVMGPPVPFETTIKLVFPGTLAGYAGEAEVHKNTPEPSNGK